MPRSARDLCFLTLLVSLGGSVQPAIKMHDLDSSGFFGLGLGLGFEIVNLDDRDRLLRASEQCTSNNKTQKRKLNLS